MCSFDYAVVTYYVYVNYTNITDLQRMAETHRAKTHSDCGNYNLVVLLIAEMRIVGWMCDIKVKDRVQSKETRKRETRN